MKIRAKLEGPAAVYCAQKAEGWLNRPSRGGVARIFCGLAAMLLGCSLTRDIEALPSRSVIVRDLRTERLTRFFKTYNCPLPHRVREYLDAADRYRIDYRLLPAISVRETTCGLTQWRNNYWGYHPGRQAFLTVEEGIAFVSQQLAEGEFYKGKSLDQKLFTYNPRPKYPFEVRSIMSEIGE
jgi:hypothetical protein